MMWWINIKRDERRTSIQTDKYKRKNKQTNKNTNNGRSNQSNTLNNITNYNNPKSISSLESSIRRDYIVKV
jgi:hypothetical protein